MEPWRESYCLFLLHSFTVGGNVSNIFKKLHLWDISKSFTWFGEDWLNIFLVLFKS